ncbi:MAG: PKD domain-containing protein, partial [Bacteroidia bacterium]
SVQCINGNNFNFNDTSFIISGTATGYWSFGDATNSSATNPSKSYAAPGTYSVKLVSTSNNGCKDSVTKTITVNAKPNVGFKINNVAQCLNGNSFIFTDTTTISGGTITRLWNFGDASSSTTSPSTKAYSNSGTYTVKLVSTSNNGCVDSVTQTITVNPKPTVGFTVNNRFQCLNANNFLFNDTSTISSGTMSRTWSFGDATNSTGITPSKAYTNSGTFSVKLILTSNNSCKDSVTKSVTVYPRPFAGYTVNNASQCFFGNNFTFTDTSTVTSGILSRLWNLGDLTTNTTAGFSKNYPAPGIYNVMLKVVDLNLCSDSVTRSITVKPNPAKPMITALSKLQLQSTAAIHYQWFLNNNPITSSNVQLLTVTQNGSYTVTIDSANGCSNTSDPYVVVSVGMQEIVSCGEIKVYPNPAMNELFINFASQQNISDLNIEIFDLKGARIMSANQTVSSGSQMKIDVSGLDAGMYFLMINNKAVKFVKEN